MRNADLIEIRQYVTGLIGGVLTGFVVSAMLEEYPADDCRRKLSGAYLAGEDSAEGGVTMAETDYADLEDSNDE